eukprot:TRINITY_DN98504_c0_g1_i1.p1 TRINITY_DN98504_c0_g1~~TRINITY_DN98504_c0_g1_i1.p1  ORF type:complete len:293 (-),score=79.12 TRINITY_DN98504_c0_g1_i1:214-1092(-)
MVVLVFCSGILSRAQPWQEVAPKGATFVPIEWLPTGTEDSVAGGEPGDFIDVTALRMLAAVLKHAAGGQPWAIAGHSAGGAVLHACMDKVCALFGDQSAASSAIAALSRQHLQAAEAEELQASLTALATNALRPPVAAVSLEGSLLLCDVEGWTDDWAKRDKAPMAEKPEDDEEPWIREALEDPNSRWTWPMAKACCASLWARCSKPRHLASIRSWMQLPERPTYVYIGGKDSGEHIEEEVFASLRSIAEELGSSDALKLGHIDNSGHNLNEDAPDAVREFLASSLHLDEQK